MKSPLASQSYVDRTATEVREESARRVERLAAAIHKAEEDFRSAMTDVVARYESITEIVQATREEVEKVKVPEPTEPEP